MYAIVQVGGRQYRAAPGERLVVDRLDVEPGSRVHLADVRMLVAEAGDDTETEIGRPRVEDVAVAARALSHFRGPKILVFKYKPKKRYRRHQGFRAELTELRIEEVRRGAYEDKPAPEPAGRRRSATTSRPARGQTRIDAAPLEAAGSGEPEEATPATRRPTTKAVSGQRKTSARAEAAKPPEPAKAPAAKAPAAKAPAAKAPATKAPATKPPVTKTPATKPEAKASAPKTDAGQEKVSKPRAARTPAKPKPKDKQEGPDGA
ncbi:MAG TPA: 50S ribosomal protein L21 [Candidatus Dormibacteraeota bacterium]